MMILLVVKNFMVFGWLVGWLVVWLFNEAVSVGNDLFGSVFVVVGWLLC